MLALAGVPVPKQMDGKSLLPALRNPADRVREHLAVLQNWDVGNRDLPKGMAVVSERWKYIYWCYGDENVPISEELFDLKRDPYESTNVANTPEMAAVLDDMRKAYDSEYWRKLSRITVSPARRPLFFGFNSIVSFQICKQHIVP